MEGPPEGLLKVISLLGLMVLTSPPVSLHRGLLTGLILSWSRVGDLSYSDWRVPMIIYNSEERIHRGPAAGHWTAVRPPCKHMGLEQDTRQGTVIPH